MRPDLSQEIAKAREMVETCEHLYRVSSWRMGPTRWEYLQTAKAHLRALEVERDAGQQQQNHRSLGSDA